MTHRKNISVIIIAFMVISGIFPLGFPIFETTQSQFLELGDNVGENDTDGDNAIDDQVNLNSPLDAAYYKSLEFKLPVISPNIANILGASYDHTYIMDVTANSTHYFFTGYTIYSDTNRSLFVMQTTKGGSIERAVTWRNSSNPGIATGGITIAIDQANNKLYVGGFYDMNSTTLSYGSSILLCFNLNTLEVLWIRHDLSYDMYVNIHIGGNSLFEFGGERIEDILVLPDGNIVIAGAKLVKIEDPRSGYSGFFYGICAFVVKISNTGTTVWSYLKNVIFAYNDPSIHPRPSVARQLLYRSASNQIFVLCDEKYTVYGESTFVVNQYITIIKNNPSKTLLTDADDGSTNLEVAGILKQNYFASSDTQIRSIAFDSSEDLFCGGVNKVGTGIGTNTPFVYALTVEGALSLPNYNIALPSSIMTNRSIEFLRFDSTNTLYVIGYLWNTPSQFNYSWCANLDPDTSMGLISSSYTLIAMYLKCYYFETSTRSFITSGYSGLFGTIRYINNTLVIDNEVLDSLDTYLNINGVQLTWSSDHSEILYFWLYRTTSPIGGIGELNPMVPIAELTSTYSFYDSISRTDGTTYYYYLKSGNDLGNSTTYSETHTQFFTAPGIIYAAIDENSILIGDNITIIWNQVLNVNFKFYAEKFEFDSGDVSGLTAKTNVEWNLINGYIRNASFKPSSLGMWYFMIVGENATRGNTYSDLLDVSVETIAVAPSSLDATVQNDDDGDVYLNWPDVPGCNYIVYKREGFAFDISTPSTEYEYVTTKSVSYALVENLHSGTWYFAIWSVNSSGSALEFSDCAFVTIHRIPLQPLISLTTKNIHTTSRIGLEWYPQDDEADIYKVYRIFSTTGTDIIETIKDLDPIYEGEDTSYVDTSSKQDGYYIYCVVAFNENGYREPDFSDEAKYVVAVVKVSDDSILNQGLITGLIIGGAILGSAGIAYIIYKKRNPWI